MANVDSPGYFRAVNNTRINQYTVKAGSSVQRGDILAYVGGFALVMLFDGTHDAPLGIAQHDAAAGELVSVFDSPDLEFIMQTSGDYTAATHDGALTSFEGTTGIQEVNENGTTVKVGRIVRQYAVAGHEEDGANATVLCRWATHALGEAPVDVSSIDGLVTTLTNDGAGYTTIADAAASTMDDLTDNTAATADTTIADVSTAVTGVDGSGSNAASKADVDTRLTAIDANFADLVAQLAAAKADITALVTKVNAILARLEAAGISASS